MERNEPSMRSVDIERYRKIALIELYGAVSGLLSKTFDKDTPDQICKITSAIRELGLV